MPQSCALVLGIYGSDTNADYWNHSTPLQQKKCIIATQSTSTWPMDCWLVGCGGDEGFQLAHERSALRYMSLHYTPLHHVWLMTWCDFLLDLHATYIRIPACKKHSTISKHTAIAIYLPMPWGSIAWTWYDLMLWQPPHMPSNQSWWKHLFCKFPAPHIWNHDRSSILAKILPRQSHEAMLLWVKELMNLPTDLYERKKMQHLTCKRAGSLWKSLSRRDPLDVLTWKLIEVMRF